MRGYGDLTAFPLRSIRTPSERQATVFVLSMLKSARRRSAFNAIPPRSIAMPLLCCGYACVLTVRTSGFCIFLGRRGITVRTWCDRGLRNTCISSWLSAYEGSNLTHSKQSLPMQIKNCYRSSEISCVSHQPCGTGIPVYGFRVAVVRCCAQHCKNVATPKTKFSTCSFSLRFCVNF